MELTGRIIAVMEPRSGVSARTGNAWMTQEYVIEVPGQYPKRCVFNIRAYNVIRGQQPVAAAAAPAGAPVASPFPPQPNAGTDPFPPAQEAGAEGSADDLPF